MMSVGSWRPTDAPRTPSVSGVAHIVLASARRLSPKPMAQRVGCAVQTVCNVIHALNTRGVEGVEKQSNRPQTVEPVLDAAHCERLQHMACRGWRLRLHRLVLPIGRIAPYGCSMVRALA